MAICTPNYTFRDFTFCLGNTFCITNIKQFLAFNMVKVKGSMMGVVTTINTTLSHFIFPKPLTNHFGSIVSLFIDSFSISWPCKPSFPHFLALYGVIFPISRFAICFLNFFWISFAPPLRGFSLALFLKFCFHNHIIPRFNSIVNIYPCKPDIFEMTYDKVD